MTLETIATVAVAVCLLIGAAFALVGSIGLVRFTDPMTRLHAPTKVGTMGIGALLLASILHSAANGESSIHEVLIMAFLFVTAPISANFMAKVHMHRRTCIRPPDPPRDETWATYDIPEDEREDVAPEAAPKG